MVKKHWRHILKTNIKEENRDALETKMSDVFGEKIKKLSSDLQQILLEDIVTAFENRVKVLAHAQLKTHSNAQRTRNP